MSGVQKLSAGLATIRDINKRIESLRTSIDVQNEIAAAVAKELDTVSKAEFAAGQTVYDEPRPLGVQGNQLALVSGSPLPKYGPYVKKKPHRSRGIYAPRGSGGKGEESGKHVRDTIGFVANGRIVRASLPQRYARYLIGKYQVLPMGGIPPKWRETVARIIGERYYAALYPAGAERKGAP